MWSFLVGFSRGQEKRPAREGYKKCYEVLVLEIPLLELSSFDIRFYLLGSATEKDRLLLNPYYEGLYLTPAGKRGSVSLPQGLRIEFLKEHSEKSSQVSISHLRLFCTVRELAQVICKVLPALPSLVLL